MEENLEAEQIPINMPSTTINKGVKAKIVLYPETNAISVTYDGDIYYGRSGNYITSFFVFQAMITNNISAKSIPDALKVLLKLTGNIRNMAEGAYPLDKNVDRTYLEGLFDELTQDIQKAIDLYSSENLDAQKTTLEGLIDRWLDIKAHTPLTFLERPVDKEVEEKKLQKQKEALAFLEQMEKKLRDAEAVPFPKNMYAALRNGDEALLRKILDKTPKEEKEKHLNATDKMLGYTALMVAAQCGSKEMAKLLVDHGADPDFVIGSLNISALHVAAENRKKGVVKYLISTKKVDVNRQKSPDNFTPLFLSAMFGDVEITELLLEAGANVNLVCDQGRTPIFYAAEYGQLGCVQVLLEHGAKVDLKDNDSNTPLHPLCSNCCGFQDTIGSPSDFYETAKALIMFGVDKTHKNKYGETPKSNIIASEQYQQENDDVKEKKYEGAVRQQIIDML